MLPFLQKLASLFRFRRAPQAENAALGESLHEGFLRFRSVDPQTQRQWLRLQRAIAQRKAEVTLRRSPLVPRLALGVASIVGLAVGAYLYFSPFSSRSSSDTIVTGRGEQKEVVLDDGSRITLNHTSRLIMEKLQSERPRRVSLEGEAYFRVQPGGAPFIISTDYAAVRVVGTEFNLRARGGGLEVAVISGIVNVSVLKDGKDSTLLLSQHQMALVLQNDFPRRTGDIPSPDYPGWMHGKLFLDRTSFQAACREIEMRFDVSIKTDNQLVQSHIITGILAARTAESAVAALCELTGRRFTHEADTFNIHTDKRAQE
jgi:ferric-dicitrate binding protein FerR (iron transport regulator)